jgi:hypothetical protein
MKARKKKPTDSRHCQRATKEEIKRRKRKRKKVKKDRREAAKAYSIQTL